VNRNFLSLLAASRTRSSPLGPLTRLGVRPGLGFGVFSLVSGLPSPASAGGLPPLFGCFAGTMPRYDSPAAFISDLDLIGFSERPANSAGATGGSRFSRMEFLRMLGVFDSTGPRRARAGARHVVAFRTA